MAAGRRPRPRLRSRALAALADATLVIADGHHRYETALAFHREDGSEASAFLLAVVVPSEQEGLTIFPTHRIVQRLGAVEAAEEIEEPPLEALERIRLEAVQ